MGAGASSTVGDGQLVPPDKRPDAARMLHARGAPLASARVPSARLAALLALAVTASADDGWTQAKKDAIDVGCAHSDACASYFYSDGWAKSQSCPNPSNERDSCACRDPGNECVIGAGEEAACADGYYVSGCGGTRDAELAAMASGSSVGSSEPWCGCAVRGVTWPVIGICFSYRVECRPLRGWCEEGYEWDGSKCVDEDADKKSPSSAGISIVIIIGIAIGGLVMLCGIGAAVLINIQKSKAAQPLAPAQPTADVVMAAPAVAAPPVATPEIEIEMGEAPRAKIHDSSPVAGKLGVHGHIRNTWGSLVHVVAVFVPSRSDRELRRVLLSYAFLSSFGDVAHRTTRILHPSPRIV